jgi:hypothetical protein
MSNEFTTELAYIKSDDTRAFVSHCLSKAPSYFWEVPASSSGKYHPEYALGNGGLVRHTKAADKIAKELLGLEQYSNIVKYLDEIIGALILHDVLKQGYSAGHTVFEHPILSSRFVWEIHYSYLGNVDGYVVAGMCSLIESHMGQWNTNEHTKIKLRKPKDPVEKFVHLCDYLASRKFIEVKL